MRWVIVLSLLLLWALPVQALTFEEKCAQPGVILCRGFDADDAQFQRERHVGTFKTGPNIDQAVTVSGAGAIRFDNPAQSDQDGAGTYPFSLGKEYKDGADLWLQVKWRTTPGWQTAPNQPKLIALGSCGTNAASLVLDRGFSGVPILYEQCGGAGVYLDKFGQQATTPTNESPLYIQQGDVQCDYAKKTGCLPFPMDEWVQYTMHIQGGTCNTASWTIEAWATRENQRPVKFIDAKNFVFHCAAKGFSGGYIGPYSTGRDWQVQYAPYSVWYDELVIATTRLDPAWGPVAEVPPTEPLPTPPPPPVLPPVVVTPPIPPVVVTPPPTPLPATTATAALITAMPGGTWLELPGTAIAPALFRWQTAPVSRNGVLEESGGAYDTDRQCMVVWGGGHNSTWDNALYELCLEESSIKWRRVNEPVLEDRRDYLNTLRGSGYHPGVDGKPDKQQPRSRHSYNYLQYVPDIKRFCSFMAGALYSDGWNSSAVIGNNQEGLLDCFDFSTKQWSQGQTLKFDIALPNALVVSAYDSTKRRVLVHGNGSAVKAWDPLTNTWSTASKPFVHWTPQPNRFAVGGVTALYDSKRQRMVFLGEGVLEYIDLTQGTPVVTKVEGVVQGEKWATLARRPGFDYDVARDKYVLWAGDKINAQIDLNPAWVYDIDPDTWTITHMVPSTAVAPRRPEPQCPCPDLSATHLSLGTMGRWRYVPQYGVFLLVNGQASTNVFVWKPPGARPGPPDGTVRIDVTKRTR